MNLEDDRSSTSIARTMMEKFAFPPKRSFLDLHERLSRRRLDNCVVYLLNCIWRTRVAAAAKKDQWFRGSRHRSVRSPRETGTSNARFLRFTYRRRSTSKRRSSLSFSLAFSPAPCSGSTTALDTLPIRGQRQSLTFKPAVGRGSLVSVVFVRARRKINAARCAVAAATCNVVMWRARDFYHTTSTSTSTTTSVRRDSHRVAASTRSRRVRFRSVSSSSQFRPFRLFPSGNVRFSRVFPRDRRPRGYASSGEAELTPVHVRDDRVGWYSTLHRRQQPSRASFSLLGLSLSSLSISLSVSLRT